jgi:hypothetical protein
MSERRLTVTRALDTFLVGRLEGERYSGVFLSPEYMARLRVLSDAVARRLQSSDPALLPDAVKNLVGVVDRLTAEHAVQAVIEQYPATPDEHRELALAQKEVDDAVRILRGLPPDESDPHGA